jgi:hypothetical protein
VLSRIGQRSARSTTKPLLRSVLLASASMLILAVSLAVASPALAAGPPTVAAAGESASEVTATGAHLGALVNPEEEPTACHFQYGTTSVSEHEVPCAQESPLNGGEQEASVNLTGLTQDTTYRYRVVVENPSGKAEGTVAEFTTVTPEPPETKQPTNLTASSATLNGVLNPRHEGIAGTYQFSYRRSPTACRGAGAIASPESPEAAGSASAAESVEATGLLPGATYTFCLIAYTEEGGVPHEAVGAPVTFTTSPLAPTIESAAEPFTNVGSSSAILHAVIDPNGLLTTYVFEYGPNLAYGSLTAPHSAGAAPEPLSVPASLEGLQPGTEYHFRVTATNADGTTRGAEGSFSTFPVGLLGLPDGRSYELVSSLDAGDSTVFPLGLVQAAPDGAAVAFIGAAPPVGGNGNNAFPNEESIGECCNQYLAERPAAGGWTATDIQPPGLATAHYQAFSPDLSTAILGSQQPLVEGGPSGEEHAGLYAREGAGYRLLGENLSYDGSTADGSDVLLTQGGSLYDAVGGDLHPVSVLPDGEPAADVSFGSQASVQAVNEETYDFDHVISADGSRIFWTTREPVETPSYFGFPVTEQAPKALYAREDASSPAARTVQLDLSQAPAGAGAPEVAEREARSGGGRFWGASSDGSKVFFTDEHQLTAGSEASAGPGTPDLYEYDFDRPAGERLVDLTAATDQPGEHADVVGVLGTSEDGSYVYFAAAGALAPDAVRQPCTPPDESVEPPSTGCNVYVVHAGEGPKLVATVTNYDGDGGKGGGLTAVKPFGARYGTEEKEKGDWVPDIAARSARVTPDGRHLAFESVEDLTGFDSKGGRELYLYDFGAGLTCVSCNPSGSPTPHLPYAVLGELPGGSHPTYAPRDLSSDGDRVFFETKEALVPGDTNEEPDVYEWERDGSGSCETGKGCLYILSGGTSTDVSYFADASESGDDVFLESRARLVPADRGETFEVYDARVGAPREPAPPACAGSGCRPSPASGPTFTAPPSLVVGGRGNLRPGGHPSAGEKLAKALKACRKDRSKGRRAECEARARRRYGPKKSGKSRKDRSPARAGDDRRINR